ncbi:MAG: hypothetical protein AB7G87_03780 [Clostridia bacterium]
MLNLKKFINSLQCGDFQCNKGDLLLDKICEAESFTDLPLDNFDVDDIYDAMNGAPALMQKLEDLHYKLIEIPRTTIVPDFF